MQSKKRFATFVTQSKANNNLKKTDMNAIELTGVKQQLFGILQNDFEYQRHTNAQQNFPELLKCWLSGVDLSNFKIDKKYLDVSWVQIDSELYDNDSLWDDWLDFIGSL